MHANYKSFLGGRRACWTLQHANQKETPLDVIIRTCKDGHSVEFAAFSTNDPWQRNLRKMMRKFKTNRTNSRTDSIPVVSMLEKNVGNGYTPSTSSPICEPGCRSDDASTTTEDNTSCFDETINLSVLLPNGRTVMTPIDAKTPMMDVLVHVTTSNGIGAGGMMLKVPVDRPPGYLHYKPNMPIGKLGCTSVEVVPKSDLCDRPTKQGLRLANQCFEQTTRIEVDLPRNHKTVLRVSPQLSLGEVLRKILEEAQLSPTEEFTLHSARSPGCPLDLDSRLADVGIVNFVVQPAWRNFRKSTSDIIGALGKMSYEEKEKRKSKGLFRLFKKKSKPPEPPGPIEIQKTTLNGQTAVEIRTAAEKQGRSAAKARPVSVPPDLISQYNNGLSGNLASPKRNSDARPKKRQAPAPPVEEFSSTTAIRPPSDVERNAQQDRPIMAKMNGTEDLDKKPAVHRRGSDSSSGYQGSSQPSPNVPANTTGNSGQHSDSERSFSCKSASSSEFRRDYHQPNHRAETSDGVVAIASTTGNQKKKKAPLPPPDVDCRNSPAFQSGALSPSTKDEGVTTASDARRSSQSGTTLLETNIDDDAQRVESCHSLQKDAAHDDRDEVNSVYSTEATCTELEEPAHVSETRSLKSTEKPTDLDEALGQPSSTPCSSLPLAVVIDLETNNAEKSVTDTEHVGLLVVKESSSVSEAQKITVTAATVESNSPLPSERPASKQPVEQVDDVELHSKNDRVVSQKALVLTSPKSPQFSATMPKSSAEKLATGQLVSSEHVTDEKAPMTVKQFVESRSMASPTAVKSAAHLKSNIVMKDPKREYYPSMTVKSFEDEYYTKKLPDDYVQTVRYGYETETAKTSGSSKVPAQQPREMLSPVADSTGAPQQAGNVQVYLMREYEKLQAMFADWQFKNRQLQSLQKDGRDFTPQQYQAFQRLQDEVLEQRLLVKKLCQESEEVEFLDSPLESTVRPGPTTINVSDGGMTSRMLSSPAASAQFEFSNGNAQRANLSSGPALAKSTTTSTYLPAATVNLQRVASTNADATHVKNARSASRVEPTTAIGVRPWRSGSLAETRPMAKTNGATATTASWKFAQPPVPPKSLELNATTVRFDNDPLEQKSNRMSYAKTDIAERMNIPDPVLPAEEASLTKSATPVAALSQQKPVSVQVPQSVPVAPPPPPAMAPLAPPPPPPPPAPPLMSPTLLSETCQKLKKVSPAKQPVTKKYDDPRADLLNAIRDFGGLNGLRKVPKTTY